MGDQTVHAVQCPKMDNALAGRSAKVASTLLTTDSDSCHKKIMVDQS